mgnify:CR=1 FL=1
MTKTLVIVESPAKAKTISKYLGSDYIVKSSVGHIRDLPKGKSKKPTQRNTIPKDLPDDEKSGIPILLYSQNRHRISKRFLYNLFTIFDLNEAPVRSNAIVNSAPGRASFTWQIAAPMPDPPWRSLEYSGQEPSAKAANNESVCSRPLPRDQSTASKTSRHPRRSRSPRRSTS